MTDRLILAERAVPRYTSYPTAPHFSGAVGPAEFDRWLGDLAAAASLSLYLHVPYCAAMCAYCGCHTKITRKREPIDAYLDALLAEIDRLARATAARRVTRIHWGGGTPMMLGVASMARVIEALSDRFDLSALGEHAVEIDPRGLRPGDARALRAMGVTRASLGVQDFNADVQRAIGRVQPFDVVQACVEQLRAAGIAALNLDLIYGLPLQDWPALERSLTLADSLAPDRIALFGYAHVPWMKSHQRLIDTAALPDPEARLAQANRAALMLEGLGYTRVGLDHFTRVDDPLAVAQRGGRLRRNFQGYVDDAADALLGLGASAISGLPQGFAQNAPDIGAYRRAMHQGHFATQRGYAMTFDDRLRGAVIERLMCDFAVRVSPALLREAMPVLSPLEEAGLVVIEGDAVAMTPRGVPFVRLAAAAFDAHLAHAGRHSAAV